MAELCEQVAQLNSTNHSQQGLHDWSRIYRSSLMTFRPALALPNTYAYFEALHVIRQAIRGASSLPKP